MSTKKSNRAIEDSKLESVIFSAPTANGSFLVQSEVLELVSKLRSKTQHLSWCISSSIASIDDDFFNFCEELDIEIIRCKGDLNRLNFYAKALLKRKSAGLEAEKDILLCDFTLIGPLSSLDGILDSRKAANVDIGSAFTFHTDIDRQFETYRDQVKVFAETNWLQISPEVINDARFAEALNAAARKAEQENLVAGEVELAHRLVGLKYTTSGFDQHCHTESSSPQWLEADKLVREGHPFIHRGVLNLDPLVYEMQTIDGRRLIDAVERYTDFDVNQLWSIILRDSTLRDVATRFNELNLIDDAPRRRSTNGGSLKIVLVVHVYYPVFIYEVIERFACMPKGSHLWVSVSSEEGKKAVLEALSRKRIENILVKVVEQNRGRDMSSLFITFRNEFLDRGVDLALRLHSKKTPQVAPQVSASFRAHLIDNLIPNRYYVDNIIDLFDQNPSIGMAVPPTIHIGFGTLGHSWFANKEGTRITADRLKLSVRLDDNTPLAAYGTMFWFRPKALSTMFEEPWGWEEFNAEPNHIDGGLAHVMERLMGYVVQSNGYRVTQIVCAKQLVANYVKLEYKLQRLASHFPTADIRQQIVLADTMFGTSNNFATRSSRKIWFSWVAVRTKIKRNHPEIWEKIRPGLKFGRRMFIELPRKSRFRRKKDL